MKNTKAVYIAYGQTLPRIVIGLLLLATMSEDCNGFIKDFFGHK
jgi:hypothetical protein